MCLKCLSSGPRQLRGRTTSDCTCSSGLGATTIPQTRSPACLKLRVHGAEATAAPQLGAHFISTLKLAGSCTLQAATFLRVLLRLCLHLHFRRRLFWPEKLSCACVYTLHLSGHLINDAYVSGHVCYGSPSSCCCCCCHSLAFPLYSLSFTVEGARTPLWLLTTDFYELQRLSTT